MFNENLMLCMFIVPLLVIKLISFFKEFGHLYYFFSNKKSSITVYFFLVIFLQIFKENSSMAINSEIDH